MPNRVPDPVEALLAREVQHDHALAEARGLRLRDLANAIINELMADGFVLDQDRARGLVFHVLADHLYGHVAIDVPGFTER
jgi:hypothetical protein